MIGNTAASSWLNRRFIIAVMALIFCGIAAYLIFSNKVLPEAEGKEKEVLQEVYAMRSFAANSGIRARFSGITKAYKSVNLRPEISGIIKKIHVNDGDFIKQGDVILEFDETESATNIKKAQKDLDASSLKLKSAKALYDKGLSSQESYLSAQSSYDKAKVELLKAQTAGKERNVKAPFDGYLEKILVKEGEYISEMLQSVLATLNSIDTMLVSMHVSTSGIKVIENATDITVAKDDVNAKAERHFISKSADPTTRTFAVEVIFKNPAFNFKAGEPVKIDVIYSWDKPIHYIPKSAIILSDSGDIAVKTVDTHSVVASVKIDIKDEDEQGFWVSGLRDEEVIIIRGGAYVADTNKVVVVYDSKTRN